MKLLALVILTITIFHSSASGQVAYAVQGTVLDYETMQPQECRILVESFPEGNMVADSVTLDGQYNFNLLPGKYGLYAEASGYLTKPELIDLTQSSVSMDIYLIPIKVEMMLSINNIYFQKDSVAIGQEGMSELHRIAHSMNDEQDLRLEIVGHASTDEGTNEEAFQLSQSRAEKVKEILIQLGISEDQLSISSYGNLQLVSPDNEKLNQRVEFRILN